MVLNPTGSYGENMSAEFIPDHVKICQTEAVKRVNTLSSEGKFGLAVAPATWYNNINITKMSLKTPEMSLEWHFRVFLPPLIKK